MHSGAREFGFQRLFEQIADLALRAGAADVSCTRAGTRACTRADTRAYGAANCGTGT